MQCRSGILDRIWAGGAGSSNRRSEISHHRVTGNAEVEVSLSPTAIIILTDNRIVSL